MGIKSNEEWEQESPQAQPPRLIRVDHPDEYALRDTYLQVIPSMWPKPQDYSWIFKSWNISPKPQATTSQFTEIQSRARLYRHLAGATMSAITRAVSSTVLFSHGVTGNMLQLWMNNAAPGMFSDNVGNRFLVNLLKILFFFFN